VPFAVRVRERQGRATVILEGELDLAAAPMLISELRRIEQHRPELLIVDLRRLVFMDLAGMRVLAAAQRRGRDAGRDVAVIRGFGVVSRIIEVTGAEAALNVISDPSEARRLRPKPRPPLAPRHQAIDTLASRVGRPIDATST
jgi:anti-sigma B factor antagonist